MFATSTAAAAQPGYSAPEHSQEGSTGVGRKLNIKDRDT